MYSGIMSCLRRSGGYVAIGVTVLTFLTLVLDLPKKLYELFPYIHPPSGVSVSFLWAETPAFSSVTKLGVFSWEPFFEINNTSKQDITVTGLETLFDSVEARGHSLRLKQVERNALFIEIYENLDALHQRNPKVGDRLPYTIKAGTKRYIGFENEYVVERDGLNISHCNTQSECMKILGESLDKNFESDKLSPDCPHYGVLTRVEFSGYASLMTRQGNELVLIIGCNLNIPDPRNILPLPTTPKPENAGRPRHRNINRHGSTK